MRTTISRNSPGQRLRQTREDLGLTLRDVVAQSQRVSKARGDRRYAVSLSVLSEIETLDASTSIFRLASLAEIYGKSVAEVLSWYGIS